MRRLVLASLVLCIACNIVSTLLRAEKPKRKRDESIALFEEVLDRVQQYHHPEKYTRRQLVEAAIEGMLMRIDPDAGFLNEEYLTFFSQTVTIDRGYPGLGIRFERHLPVVASWPDSSAFEAGILPGDQVVAIDGKSVGTMSSFQLLEALVGPPDSTVTIKVIPVSRLEPRTVTLKRRKWEY